MFFPIFVDLSDWNILVVGAGNIAARRIHTLREFAGHITVAAPRIGPQVLREMERKDGGCPLTIRHRAFIPEDLQGMRLVLAATDDPEVNRQICALCRERKIPVNVCSDQSLCDFQFPSVVRDGAVVAGINASGRDHSQVKAVRKSIEECLGIEDSDSYYNH